MQPGDDPAVDLGAGRGHLGLQGLGPAGNERGRGGGSPAEQLHAGQPRRRRRRDPPCATARRPGGGHGVRARPGDCVRPGPGGSVRPGSGGRVGPGAGRAAARRPRAGVGRVGPGDPPGIRRRGTGGGVRRDGGTGVVGVGAGAGVAVVVVVEDAVPPGGAHPVHELSGRGYGRSGRVVRRGGGRGMPAPGRRHRGGAVLGGESRDQVAGVDLISRSGTLPSHEGRL